MFKGSLTALITPFTNGVVDDKAFQSFVEWQIDQGADGLVPCGTTAESPTMTPEEHMHVTELCIEANAGRVPIIAGAGSNSTAETVSYVEHAKKAGADATLVVTPYYNKPSQAGMYAHFKAAHDAADLPIIIYNIPGRSVVDMSVETMAKLAELPNIVGVKDSTGDLKRPLLTRDAIGTEFCQLSGEDATAVPFLAAGGVGCISVTANIAPKLCAEMQRAWREGNHQKAMDMQYHLLPVHEAMFCESNPGPAKYAAQLLGLCNEEMRLPMVELSAEAKARVEEAIRTAGILN